MSRVLSTTTRPFRRSWPAGAPQACITAGTSPRPLPGGTVVMVPGLVVGPGAQPFKGMDPSDPTTYVRPWRPAPGMVAYLNFDGAARQGETEMGGLWGLPAYREAKAGGRPKRKMGGR